MRSRSHSALSTAPAALVARYAAVRAQSMALAEPLSPEDQALQSTPDASPVKWHLAHTTWFFETFLLTPHAPAFSYLFNSYYEAAGPRHPRPRRGMLSRPSCDDVAAYRAAVDAAMAGFLQSADEKALRSVAPVVELGLHHEQQHHEMILSDVKHLFSENPPSPAYRFYPPTLIRHAPPLAFVEIEGGLCEIGASSEGFAFDNERPRCKTYIEPLRIASRAVTNAEFAAFIADGGYDRPQLWLSDGWAAHEAGAWRAPLYWHVDETPPRLFTLSGLEPVNPHAPVMHVSYFEADAYARWSGARLPTEAEWEIAAAQAGARGASAEDGKLHPQPACAGALVQMIGDVWEWMSSPYTAYPGYRPLAGALREYNGKFMSGQHVLRGGSFATPQSHIRPTYRNFYPPSARWAFSGLRLAADA